MSDVIKFPKRLPEEYYITGNTDEGEPAIVGIAGRCCDIEYASNLRDFIVNKIHWISREELMALCFVTGLYDEMKQVEKDNE